MKYWQCNRFPEHIYMEDKKPESGLCERTLSYVKTRGEAWCTTCGAQNVSYKMKGTQRIHMDTDPTKRPEERCHGIVTYRNPEPVHCQGPLRLVDIDNEIAQAARAAAKKTAKKAKTKVKMKPRR